MGIMKLSHITTLRNRTVFCSGSDVPTHPSGCGFGLHLCEGVSPAGRQWGPAPGRREVSRGPWSLSPQAEQQVRREEVVGNNSRWSSRARTATGTSALDHTPSERQDRKVAAISVCVLYSASTH